MHHQNSNRNPPGWRYGDDWCDVFRRGAIDALRVAGRYAQDAETLTVLDNLAARYRDDGGLGLAG